MFSKMKLPLDPKSSPEIESSETPALGEAYAKAMSMLSPERQKVWANKITQTRQNRSKSSTLARGDSRASTSRRPLTRPAA